METDTRDDGRAGVEAERENKTGQEMNPWICRSVIIPSLLFVLHFLSVENERLSAGLRARSKRGKLSVS